MAGLDADFEKSRQTHLKDDHESSIRSSYVAGTEEETKHHDEGAAEAQPLPTATVPVDVEKQNPQQIGARPVHHVNDMTSVPNGGLMAWLQVAGSFFLFFNTWGKLT
jgi:hypothetical protein